MPQPLNLDNIGHMPVQRRDQKELELRLQRGTLLCTAPFANRVGSDPFHSAYWRKEVGGGGCVWVGIPTRGRLVTEGTNPLTPVVEHDATQSQHPQHHTVAC